jgi:hypothetical protein
VAITLHRTLPFFLSEHLVALSSRFQYAAQPFAMAASDAAVPSAVGGKGDRPSPQPAAQSKRDRKRQMLVERLASMNERFQQQKDITYRDQLQKIQFDTNLVQRFDPYSPTALDIIADLQKEHDQTQGQAVQPEGARSLLDMAGIKFHNFIGEIEDLIELRDYQLTESKVKLQSACACNPSPPSMVRHILAETDLSLLR